jgi:DNA-binding MarR family transcriptional regulator
MLVVDLDADQIERLNDSPLPRLVAIAGGLLSSSWRRVLEQHGLATSGMVLLFALSAENDLTHREAARRCWVSAGTLTGVVDSLVVEGLVTRHPDDSDRRIVRLALTRAGKERVSAAGADLSSEFGPISGGLTDDEAAVVRRYLVGLITNLEGPKHSTAAQRLSPTTSEGP